jgi:large conductance mechanosensitive channel
MLKGFKEFLARGNIVDLSVAVVIGAAFTTVVKSFTDGVVNPLVSSIGAGPKSEHGLLKQPIPGTDQFINLNDVLSAAINFIMVAAVADDAQVVLLEEIRDLLAAQSNGSSSGKHGSAHETPVQLSPPPEYGPRSDS